jgi:hypothetical protein
VVEVQVRVDHVVDRGRIDVDRAEAGGDVFLGRKFHRENAGCSSETLLGVGGNVGVQAAVEENFPLWVIDQKARHRNAQGPPGAVQEVSEGSGEPTAGHGVKAHGIALLGCGGCLSQLRGPEGPPSKDCLSAEEDCL